MPKTKRTKRKAAIATVVSPVAEFRKQLDYGKKQATLTQMYHDSDATESEVESSEDESFEKVKKPEIVSPPPVVTPTVMRFKSFKSSVNNSNQAVEVGDLVMCTAREADHPFYEEGIIDKAFILFGIVKAFSVAKWNTQMSAATYSQNENMRDKLIVMWMMIEHGLDRYVDTRSRMPSYFAGDNIYTDKRVAPPPVQINQVTVLAKRNEPDLKHLNKFVTAEVEKLYNRGVPEGWMMR